MPNPGHIKKRKPLDWYLERGPGDGLRWHAVGKRERVFCGATLPEDVSLCGEPDLRVPATYICAGCLQVVKGGWLFG